MIFILRWTELCLLLLLLLCVGWTTPEQAQAEISVPVTSEIEAPAQSQPEPLQIISESQPVGELLQPCGLTIYGLPCDCPTCQFDIFKSTATYTDTLELASEYNIDEYILFAIMYRESRFQSDAINYNSNGSTDRGICQINSVHDSWIAEKGLDVWKNNIECACILLSDLMKNYTEREAIAAYGAGLSGMLNGRGFEQADKLYLIIDELKNCA